MDKGKARAYFAVRTKMFFVDLAASVVLALCFHIFLAERVGRVITAGRSGMVFSYLVFSFIFFLFVRMGKLPIRYYSSFRVEHRFGLSREGYLGWMKDEASSSLLSLFLSVGCATVFFYVLRCFPRAWWLISAGSWVGFSVLMAGIFPVYVIPIFFKYVPLDDPILEREIKSMALRAGVGTVAVSKIDLSRKTVKVNAALVGIGTTRRVILADNLVNDLGREEVLAVVAHEFGHHMRGHIWKLIAFSGGLTLAAFGALSVIFPYITKLAGVSAAYDMRLLPFLYIISSVAGFLVMPLYNLFSCALEKEADDISLRITRDPEAFIGMMEKLAEINLSVTDPSRLQKAVFYNHPPISERIENARKYAISLSGDMPELSK
ncbi:MAG: M48 family metalloprotease [Candidatus Omnitrophica bacterium]|nr:M48 family metalloprotease [Candidatus Omnitrophota bacterium]